MHSFTRPLIFFEIRKWEMEVKMEVPIYAFEENSCKFYAVETIIDSSFK